MKELIDKILSSGLADFEGLEVSGSVPVKQELINEAIATFLQDATTSSPAKTATEGADVMPTTGAETPKSKSGGSIPVKALLGMVKRAEVQAVEGKLIVHFTVKR